MTNVPINYQIFHLFVACTVWIHYNHFNSESNFVKSDSHISILLCSWEPMTFHITLHHISLMWYGLPKPNFPLILFTQYRQAMSSATTAIMHTIQTHDLWQCGQYLLQQGIYTQLQALDTVKCSMHISLATSTGNVWFPQCFLLVQRVSVPVVSLVAGTVQSVHSVTAGPV